MWELMLLHPQGFYSHPENQIFFHNDFRMRFNKVFVVKADIPDNTKSICYNTEFVGITKMIVNIHLPDSGIGGCMRRHGRIGGFIRVIGVIKTISLFKCF